MGPSLDLGRYRTVNKSIARLPDSQGTKEQGGTKTGLSVLVELASGFFFSPVTLRVCVCLQSRNRELVRVNSPPFAGCHWRDLIRAWAGGLGSALPCRVWHVVCGKICVMPHVV